jgi:hypothetical protein
VATASRRFLVHRGLHPQDHVRGRNVLDYAANARSDTPVVRSTGR